MCLLLRRIKSGCNLCSVLYYCSVCLKDITLPKEFEDLPFSLFSRDDGLGAIVDVTHPSVAMRQGSGRRPVLFDA